MHFKSLLHVRDHAKVVGTAHHLLEYIALHVNRHTGEAFELTVERIAHRLEVTPQWVGQLRRRLVESGELLVKQSRGRHPNVYIIPYEHCSLCQKANPKGELGVGESNPKLSPGQPQSEPQRDHPNPKLPPRQPQSGGDIRATADTARAAERSERFKRYERRANPKLQGSMAGQTRHAKPILV
jgi:hypothetical protein